MEFRRQSAPGCSVRVSVRAVPRRLLITPEPVRTVLFVKFRQCFALIAMKLISVGVDDGELSVYGGESEIEGVNYN